MLGMDMGDMWNKYYDQDSLFEVTELHPLN